MISSVCVFAGSNNGNNTSYCKVAEDLGRSLANSGITTIYGGGSSGIMGSLANGVIKNDGEIVGIIPRFLENTEITNQNLSNLIITETMHERKNFMYKKSSAFIALPGGIGTMDEVCEILTWKRLQLHEKPVIFLNVNEFWTPFLNLLLELEKTGFLVNHLKSLFSVVENTDQIMSLLLESQRNASRE